jgi:plastocyanin
MPLPRRLVPALGVLGLVLLASLPASSSEFQVVKQKGGVVRGTVRYDGPRPEPKKVVPTKDTSVCKPHDDLSLVVGPKGELANAVVWLDGVTRGKPIVPTKAAVDQIGCVYTPRVQAVVVGSQVSFKNSDATFHNVHAYDEPDGGTAFNLAMPRSAEPHVRTLDLAGRLSIKCDAGHSWMLAHVWSFDHPYFAVTDANGAFQLTDVPPGSYPVKIWHETLGTLDAKVDVTAKGPTTLDVVFPAKK